MAEESNVKIEAITKAYSEVILNISKEAALRVMAAERKARSFEQQLLVLKEDSISMLLRLKQRFTSLIIEAEERSQKQQLKIEELEAQLSEAEGITVDLRGELKQLQKQLEIMRHNQNKTLSEHILVTDEPVQECASQDCAPSVSDSKSALVDSEKKTECLHPAALGIMFCHNMNTTNLPVKSHLNRSHSPNDDFTSVVMQDRETNLCRNGSTQRIHAYSDQLPRRSSCYKGQVIRTLRRSARLNSRYGEVIPSFQVSGTKFRRTKRRPFFGPLKGCLNGVNMQDGNLTMDCKKVKVGCVSKYHDLSCGSQGTVFAKGENVGLPREVSSDMLQKLHYDALVDSVLVDVPISEGIGSSNCLLADVPMSEDLGSSNQLADVPILEGFGSSNCQLAGVPISEVLGSSNDQLADISISKESENSHCQLADVPNLEGSRNNHCQVAVKDKFLKFTFYRKRRKNVLETIDKNILHDKDPMKTRLDSPIVY